jgi:glycolate oxidase iron-sulfur subunit
MTPQLLLRSEYQNMLACVRCGQCLTSCPTYVLTMDEAEGPRGRIAMARALADGQLRLTPDLLRHEMNCLVCDACTAVCPAGVHMDPIQVVLRQAIGAPAKRSAPARLGFGLLTDLGRLRLATRLLALYQRSGLQRFARASGLLKPLGLAEAEAMLPERVSASPLVPDGQTLPAEPAPGGAKVAFFVGCVMSTALADLDRATVRVLRRAGCDVALTRGQGCCGALHAHAGDLATARRMVRRNIAAFEGTDDPVVANAAGCSAMLKDYAHHLRDEPGWAERAAAFATRVVDVTELLAARELPFRNRLDAPVVYQDACHLAHAQRITVQPRALLRSIPGLELRELAEPGLCCGSAGVYNLTNPTQSGQLRARKVEHVLATGARIVATANPGCLLQLRAGLERRGSDVRVKHLVELLDEATAP